jgi:ketosteroid isomerase-like protein
MSDHRATVLAIYEAFGRGDIPAVLDRLSDDVRWEHWSAWTPHAAGVPWLTPRQGRSGAAEFFQIVGTWKILDFLVLDILVGERQVCSLIEIEAVLPDGARFRDEELHLWTFDDAGQVTRFRHYVDTAKHIKASEGG